MVWGTLGHERVLGKNARATVCGHLRRHAWELTPHLDELNVQPEHVHALFLMPGDKSIGQMAKSLKGESSRWINEKALVPGHFKWQRGYAAFSVSASQVAAVSRYIKDQDEHHRRISFAEEYAEWARKYGIKMDADE